MNKPMTEQEAKLALIADMAAMSKDPYRWVLYSFPWGQSGTELEKHDGPDEWQTEILTAVRDDLLTVSEAMQYAVASGHGVGKSALVAWLVLWAMSTHEDTRGIVTANTEAQLRTKTWPELAKWYRRFIAKDWFKFTATALFSVDPEHEKTWRVDAVTWSENNTEAFQGLHNQGKRLLVVFDEASAIPDLIWETTEGALTDAETEILWFAFGNPTRNTGRFRQCFGRLKHRWKTWRIDSRSAKMTDKAKIEKWRVDYGEDSDFFRVRVRGMFPRASSMQFISSEIVAAAQDSARDVPVGVMDPLIIGVDVGRYGDDPTVIRFRRGRDGRTIPPIELRGLNTMQVAARVVEEQNRHKADAIFVDGGGVGGGVVDRLLMLRQPVIEVQFGGKADRAVPTQEGAAVYANKRAEMWGAMRDWLPGGAVDDSDDLEQDLTGIEYGYVLREGRDAILLEKKEDMKERGLGSPNHGDALALTFAYPVQPSDHRASLSTRSTHQSDFDPTTEWYAAGPKHGRTR